MCDKSQEILAEPATPPGGERSPGNRKVDAADKTSSNDTPCEQPEKARKTSSVSRWWVRSLVNVGLFLAAGSALIAALGAAQRLGWISASGGRSTAENQSAADNPPEEVGYVCPMMCTPRQTRPGR
ncbi:MAG: hypothetical protein GXP27_16605, partial [Planctomycetes bacterium]|nr:hypothetical protein [Planctomycetota bacterium]